MQENEKLLSDQDFEVLQKSLQLLRISQLRYIVQRFSFCITGNKSKLVNVLSNYFVQFRYIYNEVMKIVSQYNEPFVNPLQGTQKLRVLNVPNFYIRNNFMMEIDKNHILGPIYVPRGMSHGEFDFTINNINHERVCMIFTWDSPESTPFDLYAYLNDNRITIKTSDVCPGTIDITNIIKENNKLLISSIKTNVPFIITINFFNSIGLRKYMLNMGYNETEDGKINVMCKHCKKGEFDALMFLSMAISFGNWNCPFCGEILKLEDLVQLKK